MTTQTKKRDQRMRLGPVVRELLATYSNPTSAELDSEVQELIRDREKLKSYVSPSRDTTLNFEPLENRLDRMSEAVVSTGELITNLTELTDHRTRELAKLFLHISTMVGVKFTDNEEERDRLHRRFNEMFQDLEKQMTSLSKLLKQKQVKHEKSMTAVQASMDEQRVAIVEKQRPLDRGMER